MKPRTFLPRLAFLGIFALSMAGPLRAAPDEEKVQDANKKFHHAVELLQQGYYGTAEKEFRAVLALCERLYGKEGPTTLKCREQWAQALEANGKHAEAEREQRAVLAVRERAPDTDNLEILERQLKLAQTQEAHGKHAEAERGFRAVLAATERVLGTEHPGFLKCCYDLAACLAEQKKLPEALEFGLRAEAGYKKIFRKGDPGTNAAVALRERIEAAMAGKPTP